MSMKFRKMTNERFFLVWDLLHNQKTWHSGGQITNVPKITLFRYEEGFTMYYARKGTYYSFRQTDELIQELILLCLEGIIDEVYLDRTAEWKNPDYKKEHYKFGDSYKKFFSRKTFADGEKVLIFVKVNELKVKTYQARYLKDWKKSKFYQTGQNLLKPEKQLASVVEEIYCLLDNHSVNNLLLRETLRFHNIDFLITIFFLQKIGAIKMISINSCEDFLGLLAPQYQLLIRINVLDEFFSVFKDNKISNTSHSKGTVSLSSEDKENNLSNVDIIYYDFRRFMFYYKNKELHKITQGKEPWNIFNRAFNETGSVYKFTHEKTTFEERQGLNKKIQDFKRILRRKLHDHQASTKLYGDFLVKMNGPNINISKIIKILDKPWDSGV